MSGTKTTGAKKTVGADSGSSEILLKTGLPADNRPPTQPVTREEALRAAGVALQSAAGANEQLARALALIH